MADPKRAPAPHISRLGTGTLSSALRPIAPQLITLDMEFILLDGERTSDMLGLISACSSLRHLELGGAFVSANLINHAGFQPPTYHLTSLELVDLVCYLDSADLAWFIGRSAHRPLRPDAQSPAPRRTAPARPRCVWGAYQAGPGPRGGRLRARSCVGRGRSAFERRTAGEREVAQR